MKIEHAVYQSAKMFGRHFDEKDEVLSHVTRQSIDVLKVCFWAKYYFLKEKPHYVPCRRHLKLMCRTRNGFSSEPSSL